MNRMIAATTVAFSLAVTMAAAQAPQPPKPQPETTPQAPKPQTETAGAQPQAKNLMQDVTKVGCLKAWQPGPADATKSTEPARLGVYLLTPISADPVKATVDLPTYSLVGGATVNFAAHLNHKVEISGVEQNETMPPTVQETVTAPTMKAENKPDIKRMPTLTVRSLKMLSATCS